MQQSLNIKYEVFHSLDELTKNDQELLLSAINATQLSYSPYSKFKVGCAGTTNKGNLILGSNQENASFSVTTCAERVLLNTLASIHPGEYLTNIAISYIKEIGANAGPISPCGVCRQALLEHETVYNSKIRLILGGQNGSILIINNINDLLPFAFTNSALS